MKVYDEHMLTYNFGLMSWTWDDKAVEQKLMTENVSTILVNKLRRFDTPMQNVMKVASCIGASFSTKVLSAVIENSARQKFSRSDSLSFSCGDTDISSSIGDAVSVCIEQGLWEQDTEDECKFSHDQIQVRESRAPLKQ